MKIVCYILLCALSLAVAAAEEEAKKDTMVVEYRSVGPFPSHGVTMAGALKALGITPEKIDHIRLVGDESSMTTGLSRKVEIDKEFWDRYFETAEPYKYWVSSGNRRLEIYLKGDFKPKTTIYINEADGCTADGDTRQLRYMCHGLHRWFMAKLKPEIGKSEGGPAESTGRPDSISGNILAPPIDEDSLEIERLSKARGSDAEELGKAIAVATNKLQATVPSSSLYKLIKIELVRVEGEAIWQATFKLSRLIPQNSKEVIGAGGEVFVSVDLKTGRATVRYGE